MSKFNVGKLFGKKIYIGDPKQLRNGEYMIKLEGKKPVGFFIKQNGNMVSIFDANSLNLENVNILSTNHGDSVTVNPSDGYDAIGKVTYKKAALEEKDAIMITENNSTTEIKVGANYDGLDDITIIVNVENNE